MAEQLSQTVEFEAGVDRVFRAIAESDRHTAFTGAPADLASEPGGPFTTHGGAIEGVMLEIVPNERIVQAWRPADWPAGVFSLVRYDFGGDGDRATITLTHAAIPEGGSEHLADGWNQRYWGPLEAYLKEG